METLKITANVTNLPAEGGDVTLIIESTKAGICSNSFTKLNDGSSMGTIDLPVAPPNPKAPDVDYRSFPAGITLAHAHITARPTQGDPTWDNYPLTETVMVEVQDPTVSGGWVCAFACISMAPYAGVPVSPIPTATNVKIYTPVKGRKK